LDTRLSKLHLGVEAKKSQIGPQTLGEKHQRKRPRKKNKKIKEMEENILEMEEGLPTQSLLLKEQ
jgi:hypothetical protein